MKNRIRIVRQPWTKNITDTFESRVYEKYLMQEYPQAEISYIGGDFSLSYESGQEESRNVVLIGKLTEDPLNFLILQPYISVAQGIKISEEQSKVRGHFTSELLFESETFRREFSSILIGTQDTATQVYLENRGITCFHLSYTSILLGLIKDQRDLQNDPVDYLFVDLSQELLQVLQEKISPSNSFAEISTQIPEILGELEKNSKIDLYISLLTASKVVITSNPVFAFAAYSLGREVIFVSNSMSSELLVKSEEELIDGLSRFDLSEFSHRLPREKIMEMQVSLKDFIEKSLAASDRVRVSFEAHAYKDQVISELVNYLSKRYTMLVMSRTWKIAVVLRKVIGFVARSRKSSD